MTDVKTPKHCGYDMLERKDPYDNFKPFWWCPQCGARKPMENKHKDGND